MIMRMESDSTFHSVYISTDENGKEIRKSI